MTEHLSSRLLKCENLFIFCDFVEFNGFNWNIGLIQRCQLVLRLL